jgi:outer membrane immunogenic protein
MTMKLVVSAKFSISAFAGVVLMSGIAGDAFAADLPAPSAPPVPTWNGCFVGVHTGGALSEDKIGPFSNTSFSSAGAIAGGQGGCDAQVAPGWVVGAGGKASWSSLSSSTPGHGFEPATGLTFPYQFSVDNDFLAQATGRVGHTFGSWLFYVDGGGVWTREKMNAVFTLPSLGVSVDTKATTTRAGWTAGAGVEWAFAPNWSTNLEYGYYDFGSNDYLLTEPSASLTGNLRDTIQTVTVGVNYRF